MKRHFFKYILYLFGLLAISCQDDLSDSNANVSPNTPNLAVEIDIPEARTRAIDMTPMAPLYLQKIWVGIYERNTGTRVGGSPRKLDETTGQYIYEPFDLQNRLTSAGVEIENLLPYELYDNTGVTLNSKSQLCVVAVANFEPIDPTLNIYTNKGNGEEETLLEALCKADNWDDFKNITVNTNSNGFINQTPVLMGYLYNKSEMGKRNFTYTKIDQFNENNGIQLICTTDASNDAVPIWVNPSTDGKTLQNGGYMIRLRRLRSKINVHFEPYKGVTIKGVSYKVYNKPNSVFLAQRRTNDFLNGKSNSFEKSPNSADLATNGYSDDKEWIVPENIGDFSFEHFENKHWAIREVGAGISESDENRASRMYHDREAETSLESGVFTALANSASEWNNDASYFVLKMTILDENTGRYGDVEYLIHEGYCNDQFGNDLSDEYDINGELVTSHFKERLNDFQCIRNTNYTYNIQVRGVNDIVVQVTSVGNNGYMHENDQGGSIWQMNYAWMYKVDENGKEKTTESGKRIKSNQVKSRQDYIVDLSDNPITFDGIWPEDIAFRIVGQSKGEGEGPNVSPTYSDVCFNFKRGELDGFANLWPSPSEKTNYLVNTDAGESPLQSLLDFNDADARKMLDNIQVRYNGEFKSIKDYIIDIYEIHKPIEITGFKFKGYDKSELGDYYDESNPRNNIRALYIFDREKAILGGKRIKTDLNYSITVGKDAEGFDIPHECSFLYEIYAAEQLPFDKDEVEEPEEPLEPVKKTIYLTENDMIWHSEFHVGTRNNCWCGAKNSIVELSWYHNPAFIRYTVEIEGRPSDGFVIEKEDIDKYLTYNGARAILTYPLKNLGWSSAYYNVTITPEVDESKYISGGPYTKTNGIWIGQDYWELTKAPWTGVVSYCPIMPLKSFEYDGLELVYNATNLVIRNGALELTGAGGLSTGKYFKLWVVRAGELQITGGTNGAKKDRAIVVSRLDENGNEIDKRESPMNFPSYSSTNSVTYGFNFTADQVPCQVIIYPTATITFSKIQFKKE